MKKLFTLVFLLCSVLSVCCASPPKAASAPPLRTFDLILHVDTAFTGQGRELIEKAAANVRRLTYGRANLTVAFDLDFESVPNLEAHRRARHSTVIAVLSSYGIVQKIDASLPGPGTPLAATTSLTDGSQLVILILDRIPTENFLSVVTHEFGHVIGFPDLPEMGAIMSGRTMTGTLSPTDWTAADVALCQQYRYCE